MSERFVIKLRNKRVKKNWELSEREIPEAMASCKKFLLVSPEDRLKSGGKLKKLKGRFHGFLQYDITGEARVWYRVDNQERVVYVEYIGHHP
ncbi:MAG: hypothetical protein Q8O43_00935 [Dehalococcoidia bacterium]|nr:hypothetical protein [Dehalococcoidia bacterium]